jgi:hypothetical protein
VTYPLDDYVAKQLADILKARRVVVWYDKRGEFQSFVDGLRGRPPVASETVPVAMAGMKASLAEYAGSMFELRAIVEPLVSGDKPDPLVIYIPGAAHDAKASVLMELEKAGKVWAPELKQLAKNVLLQKYTLGVVDEMLPPDRYVSYEDLARASAANSGAEPPSILRSIFHDVPGNDELLMMWLVSDARDAEIASKDATRELVKLVKARLGLDLVADSSLGKLRAITLRYVLAGEFRLDLSCDVPASLDSIVRPSAEYEDAVREIARGLRAAHPDAYAALADRLEEELGLTDATLPPGALGAIDTFRFEERALLRHASDRVANSEFEEALALVVERESSFWLDRDVNRKAQWEAVRRMAELGGAAIRASAAVGRMTGDAAAWLDAYVSTGRGGTAWFGLDQAQRRLEAWIANLDEDPAERALGIVRRAYEDACRAMATGFTKALATAGWSVPGVLHQTHIWSTIVADRPKPVAYFLVDAMRYEMGIELAERLPKSFEISVRPAVGALPSITPVGMAALQPGASASFAVVEQGGALGARVDDAFLPDIGSRKRFAAARVPKLVDLPLDELLSLTSLKLAKKIDGAQVVIVRSQEIDHAGEAGFMLQARQTMDTVIDNLARAIRKISQAGIEHAVVAADHGHLFMAEDRDESMRVDPPGGQTVQLHRRCWVGRGGATPPGCTRVTGAALGYDSDLDVMFPPGISVFKAGGDLAYYHGGATLQELVIPVLAIRMKGASASRRAAARVAVEGTPEAVTNRIFTVTLQLTGKALSLFAEPLQLRPLLVADGRQVGSVGMAAGADFDRATGCVVLKGSSPVTVAFVLTDESVRQLRIVVQDPSTDAELYRSPSDIVVRLGV